MTQTETAPVSQRENRASWLDDAVIYEIYPQSFADSNGDGIGDLQGVIDHLDHLAWLGVNTIWFNPCFASPFRDAGYDVSDYLQIAPRYGSNDDLVALCARPASAASGCCSTSSPGTPRSRTSGSSRSPTVTVEGPADGDRYIWRAAPSRRQ